MNDRNLDLGIPLTRAQWEQLGQSANMRPDYGVFRWSPHEFDVIRLAIREDEAPAGWRVAVPPADIRSADREVARFHYNDGRPFASVEPPEAPAPPAIAAQERLALDVELERWVREHWHILLRESGIAYDRGAIPADEPNPPNATA